MKLTESVLRKMVIAVIEWDTDKVSTVKEAEQLLGKFSKKERLIFIRKTKIKKGVLYTVVSTRSGFLKEDLRNAIYTNMVTVGINTPEIKEVFDYNSWKERFK